MMKNTTNILLIVVIILVLALLIDKRVSNNELRADGAINGVIFCVDPIIKDRFYMVNTETKLITFYEYDQSKQAILLKTARQYDYDSRIQGFYKAASNQGDIYEVTKSVVENKKK
jgi:hypothetical protein